MAYPEPEDLSIIPDLETLRVVSEPLRAQIYEIFTGGAYTVRQVGERLGQPASRLYYHVGLLEKVGLLRVVDTRQVANIVEKVYRAVAYHLELAPDIFSFATDEGQETVSQMMANQLNTTREDMLRSFNARLISEETDPPHRPARTMISRSNARIPAADAQEFEKRLEALIDEFKARNVSDEASADPEVQNFALLVAFYPSLYFPPDR